MTVERTKNEVIIRLPTTMDFQKIEEWIEYFRLMEIISKNKGTEEEALKLTRELDKEWWEKNRNRFIK